MNLPHIELRTANLAGRALFDSLLVFFRYRADRFQITVVSDEAEHPAAATFEDLRGDQPQWPVRLEFDTDARLIGRIDGDLDPDIGTEIYDQSLQHTVYVVLLLFDAEEHTDVELRRVTPDQ